MRMRGLVAVGLGCGRDERGSRVDSDLDPIPMHKYLVTRNSKDLLKDQKYVVMNVAAETGDDIEFTASIIVYLFYPALFFITMIFHW